MSKKFILDVCCGRRYMWFNKHHPNTIYIDIQETVKPDMVMNNKKLEFPDKSFKLVVMDPPQLLNSSKYLKAKFGGLNAETWPIDLKAAFEESWRVLEDYGVLIFKWNDHDISVKKILKILERRPLFGQKTKVSKGGRSSTVWLTFMKIPKIDKGRIIREALEGLW